MMMIPRRRNDFDLFGDIFEDPFFSGVENKLMKTDIQEKKDSYLIDIDLPGYDKKDIKIEIKDGYLTINASKTTEDNEKEKGKFIRKERYSGHCSRTFYIGENIDDSEIKATFKNGILNIEVPKKEEQKIDNKKYIEIE